MKKIHNPHDRASALLPPMLSYHWALGFGYVEEKLRHSQENKTKQKTPTRSLDGEAK